MNQRVPTHAFGAGLTSPWPKRRPSGRATARAYRRYVHPSRLTLWLGSLWLAATTATIGLRAVVGGASPAIHATVATASGLTSALICVLFGRVAWVTRNTRDFLLALAFGIFACGALAFDAGPSLLNGGLLGSAAWGAGATRLLGIFVLAGAALGVAKPMAQARRLIATVLAGTTALLTVAAGVALSASPRLPMVFGQLILPAPGKGGSAGDPLVLYLQVVAALLTAIAAIHFARQRAHSARLMSATTIAGIMIMAGASAGAVLVSSALTVDTPVAGAVTLLGYLFVVQAELAGEFLSRVAGAVAAERRRIARDIHDGLAQELAFIVSQSQRLEGSGRDSDIVVHLQSAARRALQESRLAVAFLNADDNTPLDMLISQGVRAFQARSPVQVDLELASSVVVDAEKQTAMLRILNEAMSNGVRHGGAEHLSVRLEQDGDRLSLSVADDGTGFDVACACDSPTGWGLISMRERAELLGGRLRLFSRPASGTLVEVVLPHG